MGAGTGQVTPAGFNPRPLLLTGESRATQPRCTRIKRFNPRPLLLTGESVGLVDDAGGYSSFNPRPLLLTGESRLAVVGAQEAIVSIHARYC